MAKQLKKIRRNLRPQAGGTNTEKRPEKKGKDTFLLIMIALTFFIALSFALFAAICYFQYFA